MSCKTPGNAAKHSYSRPAAGWGDAASEPQSQSPTWPPYRDLVTSVVWTRNALYSTTFHRARIVMVDVVS